MNKYVTRLFSGEADEMNAGSKAKNDVNFFLNQLGFENIDIHIKASKVEKFLKTDYLLKKQVKVTDNSIFVLQYPLGSKYISNKISKLINSRSNFLSICLIHDLEGLRVLKDDSDFKRKEIKYLNDFKYLIVHNPSMKQWLKNNGITSNMIVLNLFDYYNPCEIINDQVESDVVYAGNLAKAKFLEDLKLKNHSLDVYGVNQLSQYPNNINYKGSLSPEKLPEHLKARFGLVWDGDSIDECSGMYGQYLKYNTPHKISLYLSSGIPVIVWNKSAMSDFIVNNNLGISIDDVGNLDNILDKISEEAYFNMKNSVVNFAYKLRSGFFIKNAVNEVLKIEDNSKFIEVGDN